jgi:hypothetical protein
MSFPDSSGRATSLEWLTGVYADLLREAREVTSQSLDRLRALAGLLPAGALEAVEQLADHPAGERRQVVRLPEESVTVTVVAPENRTVSGTLRDRSPKGIAVLLPDPLAVGIFLLIMVNETATSPTLLAAEVRYSRPEGGAWVVGCEVLNTASVPVPVKTG